MFFFLKKILFFQVWYSDKRQEEWEEKYDDQTGLIYFYNEKTNKFESNLPPISTLEPEPNKSSFNQIYKEGTINWGKYDPNKKVWHLFY